MRVKDRPHHNHVAGFGGFGDQGCGDLMWKHLSCVNLISIKLQHVCFNITDKDRSVQQISLNPVDIFFRMRSGSGAPTLSVHTAFAFRVFGLRSRISGLQCRVSGSRFGERGKGGGDLERPHGRHALSLSHSVSRYLSLYMYIYTYIYIYIYVYV